MRKMENTIECYTELWMALDKAYEHLKREQRRYCIHNLVRELYKTDAEIPRMADGSARPRYQFIWQVCWAMQTGGYEQLTAPLQCRKKSRNLVHALAMIAMNAGFKGVSLQLIDQAYKEAKRKVALRNLDELQMILG